jgi:FMN phosphatase YigB (HAD superfamily)
MGPLRKRLLLIDHDDTAVSSTAQIHYPAHCESVRVLLPGKQPCSLTEWFEVNHSPGVKEYLGSLFAPEQMDEEHAIWTRAIEAQVRLPHAPATRPALTVWPRRLAEQRAEFFAGLPELLSEFKLRGGRVVVVSHSQEAIIRADYAQLLPGSQPDMVFGWEKDPLRRKPSPYPARQALAALGLQPEDALVLDDLSPGISMAGAPAFLSALPVRLTLCRYTVSNSESYLQRRSESRRWARGGGIRCPLYGPTWRAAAAATSPPSPSSGLTCSPNPTPRKDLPPPRTLTPPLESPRCWRSTRRTSV